MRYNNPLIIAQTFGGIFIYIFIFISTPLLYTHIIYTLHVYTYVSQQSDSISTRHSRTPLIFLYKMYVLYLLLCIMYIIINVHLLLACIDRRP